MRYAELGVPPSAIPWIERSFSDDAPAPSVYGRMDFAFGPDGVPKLLEYNADTPTSLLEGAVIQVDVARDDAVSRHSTSTTAIDTKSLQEFLPRGVTPHRHWQVRSCISDVSTASKTR